MSGNGHGCDMHEKYLGDSYDLVKRFWAESLSPIAPLFAHPQFVPVEIQERYTVLTLIPILDPTRPPKNRFGLLLDPDTGIPLPDKSQVRASVAHASFDFISDVMARLQPAYMICFDQSYHRGNKNNKAEQLEKKREFLYSQGIDSFYYFSHAPFLFMAAKPDLLSAVIARLMECGVPADRFVMRAQARSRQPLAQCDQE
jgi:hypothetical protein